VLQPKHLHFQLFRPYLLFIEPEPGLANCLAFFKSCSGWSAGYCRCS